MKSLHDLESSNGEQKNVRSNRFPIDCVFLSFFILYRCGYIFLIGIGKVHIQK